MFEKAGFVLGCLVALPAVAAEGRIPIWFPNPTTPVPYAIVLPGGEGRYELTRNIDASGVPGPAIIVNGLCGGSVGSVEIDLNGFTVTGGPGGPIVAVTCVESFTLRNGTVETSFPGVAAAVDVQDVGKSVIEDLKIGNTITGISIRTPRQSFAVRRNLIRNVGGSAIYADDSGIDNVEGSIEDNVIRDSGNGINALGFALGATSLGIRNNRIERTFDPALGAINVEECHALLLIENTVDNSAAEGIRLRRCSSSKIVNNVVSRSGAGGAAGHGIALYGGTGNLFLDNVSGESVVGDGLFVFGENNTVRGNVLSNNAGFGLHFVAPAGGGGFNTFGDNSARGNLGAGVCAFVPPLDGFCPTPGGSFPPGICNEEAFPSNTSFCTNLLPGPPVS